LHGASSAHPDATRATPPSRRHHHTAITTPQAGVTLNADLATSAFVKAMPAIDYLLEVLGLRSAAELEGRDNAGKMLRVLKGMSFNVTHRASARQFKGGWARTMQAVGDACGACARASVRAACGGQAAQRWGFREVCAAASASAAH
jgi:hypothetical protein